MSEYFLPETGLDLFGEVLRAWTRAGLYDPAHLETLLARARRELAGYEQVAAAGDPVAARGVRRAHVLLAAIECLREGDLDGAEEMLCRVGQALEGWQQER